MTDTETKCPTCGGLCEVESKYNQVPIPREGCAVIFYRSIAAERVEREIRKAIWDNYGVDFPTYTIPQIIEHILEVKERETWERHCPHCESRAIGPRQEPDPEHNNRGACFAVVNYCCKTYKKPTFDTCPVRKESK